MPKKPFLTPKSEKYVLILFNNGNYMCYEYFTAASAVKAYRNYRESYGDAVRLTKVVIDYGEEI